MSLLGEYRKQPVEVEVYGIQFAQDMATTDQIETAFQLLSRDSDPVWDQVVYGVPYTATVEDDKRTLVAVSDITLPTDAVDGYHLNVCNGGQLAAINVGSFSVPARGSIIILRKNGTWVQEAKTTSVLVDALEDQRVRVWVYGGTLWEMYKVQVTVTTAEGRTMQDEFTVEIEEI